MHLYRNRCTLPAASVIKCANSDAHILKFSYESHPATRSPPSSAGHNWPWGIPKMCLKLQRGISESLVHVRGQICNEKPFGFGGSHAQAVKDLQTQAQEHSVLSPHTHTHTHVQSRARSPLFKSVLQNEIKRWASKCQCLAPLSGAPLRGGVSSYCL